MCMMWMWWVTLIFSSYAAAQVTSDEIKVECRDFYDLPPSNNTSPSFLKDLKVTLVNVQGVNMLNISWAVTIDASNKYLTSTHFDINGKSKVCEYHPSLFVAKPTGSEKWFHHLVRTMYGVHMIQGANFPLPPTNSGISYKKAKINVPRQTPRVTPKTTNVPKVAPVAGPTEKPEPANVSYSSIVMSIVGVLAGLVILSLCYLTCKRCAANVATSLGFKKLPTSHSIPVLVVYPAENSAFQRAVVALAEFLQGSGCSVAVDMWQQGRIAELGPMRWLGEQAKAAHRVLIVCPQISSQPNCLPPNLNSPETSIPAAAHDLYPLILNMVGSHAKSASDLDKFWVVQLGKQDKKQHNFPLELRACKMFSLMGDLNKLYTSLTHNEEGKRMPNLICRPGIAYSKTSAVKLREAIEHLGGHQPSISTEVAPLMSVVTTP